MRVTLIDRTAVRVSRLAFGTAALHHLFSAAQRLDLLGAAALSGISHFDTSPYYGLGLAESDLGRFLNGQRSRFTVTTKVGLYPWGEAAGSSLAVWARKGLGKLMPRLSRPDVDWSVSRARNSLRMSLGRLQTDHVDFLLLHEPDIGLLDSDELVRWLEAELALGTVRCWGLAGEAVRLVPWTRSDHALAQVVQTRDSLADHQANFLLEAGRALQFTYGYLSSMPPRSAACDACAVLRLALERNTRGSVIVSTRQKERLAMLAEAAS
jgi:aryl-alcohol dehydrogenase-like predicted oxidoreductase